MKPALDSGPRRSTWDDKVLPFIRLVAAVTRCSSAAPATDTLVPSRKGEPVGTLTSVRTAGARAGSRTSIRSRISEAAATASRRCRISKHAVHRG